MFASRIPAAAVCLVALAASAVFVQWAAGNQVVNGRASLTHAARRYLAEASVGGTTAVLVKVETEVGGLKGFTEAQVAEPIGHRHVWAERVVLEWAREDGGEWRVVGSSSRGR